MPVIYLLSPCATLSIRQSFPCRCAQALASPKEGGFREEVEVGDGMTWGSLARERPPRFEEIAIRDSSGASDPEMGLWMLIPHLPGEGC